METKILTTDMLIEIFGHSKVEESTYITPRGYTHIRLTNTKPEKSLVPSLYPNQLKYKKELLKYDNVINTRGEIKDGTFTGNQKIDVNITELDISLQYYRVVCVKCWNCILLIMK